MADEKKPTTKKADAAKAAGEKAEAKKAATKSDAKKASAKKESAPKKTAKKATAKKDTSKKAAKAKKEPAKKAAPKAAVAAPVVRASARYVRIAPRKARLIADQVRGLHIEKARALLQFSPRGAAEDIHKLIDSAAANAENNHDLIGDEMRVSSITVDEGPTLKRFRPRAMGRATPIHKRTSHIAVALTPVED
jgi:ribosomal protein L22